MKKHNYLSKDLKKLPEEEFDKHLQEIFRKEQTKPVIIVEGPKVQGGIIKALCKN